MDYLNILSNNVNLMNVVKECIKVSKRFLLTSTKPPGSNFLFHFYLTTYREQVGVQLHGSKGNFKKPQ